MCVCGRRGFGYGPHGAETLGHQPDPGFLLPRDPRRPAEGAEQPVDPVSGVAADPVHTSRAQAIENEVRDLGHGVLLGGFGEHQPGTRGRNHEKTSLPRGAGSSAHHHRTRQVTSQEVCPMAATPHVVTVPARIDTRFPGGMAASERKADR